MIQLSFLHRYAKTILGRLALMAVLVLVTLTGLAGCSGSKALGCCQLEDSCFATDDEAECEKVNGQWFQLAICGDDGRCQPTAPADTTRTP